MSKTWDIKRLEIGNKYLLSWGCKLQVQCLCQKESFVFCFQVIVNLKCLTWHVNLNKLYCSVKVSCIFGASWFHWLLLNALLFRVNWQQKDQFQKISDNINLSDKSYRFIYCFEVNLSELQVVNWMLCCSCCQNVIGPKFLEM